MWQDKNDTCLIVRQRRRAGEVRKERMRQRKRAERAKRMDKRSEVHQNARRLFGLDSRLPRPLANSRDAYLRTPARCCIKSPSKQNSIVSRGGPHLHALLSREMRGSRFIAISKSGSRRDGFFEIYQFRESHVCKLKRIKGDN